MFRAPISVSTIMWKFISIASKNTSNSSPCLARLRMLKDVILSLFTYASFPDKFIFVVVLILQNVIWITHWGTEVSLSSFINCRNPFVSILYLIWALVLPKVNSMSWFVWGKNGNSCIRFQTVVLILHKSASWNKELPKWHRFTINIIERVTQVLNAGAVTDVGATHIRVSILCRQWFR